MPTRTDPFVPRSAPDAPTGRSGYPAPPSRAAWSKPPGGASGSALGHACRLILRGATPVVHVSWLALAAVAVFAAAAGRWSDVLVAFLCFASTLLPLSMPSFARISLPARAVDAVVVFFVATLGLGEIFDFYWMFRPWDWLMHSAAGFGVTFAGAALIVSAVGGGSVAPLAGALLAAAFSVACGTGWEIFEFTLDRFFGLNTQKGFTNTMLDLVANTAGAGVAVFYVRRWWAGHAEVGPTRVLGEFIRAHPHLFQRQPQVPQKVR